MKKNTLLMENLSRTGFTPLENIKTKSGFNYSKIFKNSKRFLSFLRADLRLPSGNLSLTGFTLLELLIVIILISSIIALSIPTIAKTAKNFYFRTKAKQIEALFNYLQKKAVMEERSYKCVFDFSGNSYTVLAENKQSKDVQFFKKEESFYNCAQPSKEIFLKADGVNNETEEVVFLPDGSITAIELQLTDNKKQTAKITTTLSGQINLEFL